MSRLTIKDLAIASDLDAAAMSAVRGGYQATPSSYSFCMPKLDLPSCYPASTYSPPSLTVDASQMIGQSQNVMNNNGNNVAFASGISSTVNPTQSANNSIHF